MDVDRFKALVAELEQQSAASPGAYRAKVAALTLLGFAIMALMIGSIGLGLLLVVALLVVAVVSGGAAWLLVLKLAKVLWFLVIPLWFLLKAGVQALFVRLPAPTGRALTRAETPALFDALDDMRRRMKGPHFHHVLIVDEVNAAVTRLMPPRQSWSALSRSRTRSSA